MSHDIFFNIARVVCEHDQTYAENLRQSPKHGKWSKNACENLIACQWDKASHDDAADSFPEREVGNRSFARRVEHNENCPDSADCKGNQSCVINHVATKDKC